MEKFNIDSQRESEDKERVVNPVEVAGERLEDLLSFIEPFFETESDPAQIPATPESYQRLLALDSHTVALRADVTGRIISYAAVLPTARDLMERFMRHEITEREMFDATNPQPIPETLYLMAVAVAPDFKGRGDVFGMMREMIDYFKQMNPNINLFVWEFSEEGKRFVSILEKRHGLSIKRY